MGKSFKARVAEAYYEGEEELLLQLMPPRTYELNEEPIIIRPGVVDGFDSMFARRREIQQLKLVPIKSQEVHDDYNAKKLSLVDIIVKQISEAPGIGFIQLNEFPYQLPPDVKQHIIWMKDHATDPAIVKMIVRDGRFNRDLILFERPIGIVEKYKRGSFPFARHIHLWSKEDNESEDS